MREFVIIIREGEGAEGRGQKNNMTQTANRRNNKRITEKFQPSQFPKKKKKKET
jgi:hypothetical protein